jgi:hypothetical protein
MPAPVLAIGFALSNGTVCWGGMMTVRGRRTTADISPPT